SHVLGIGTIVAVGEPIGRAEDELEPIRARRRTRLAQLTEFFGRELAVLEVAKVHLHEQETDALLSEVIETAHPAAGLGRVETALRIREWLTPLPEDAVCHCSVRRGFLGVRAASLGRDEQRRGHDP